MKENDITDILRADQTLREAVSRREQQLPPMPAGLDERLMRRIETESGRPGHRHLWLYTAIAAVAASLLLLIALHLGKDTTDELPPVTLSAEGSAGDPARIISLTGADARAPKVADAGEGTRAHSVADAGKGARAHRVAAIPDTLGSGIWQSERNVVRAVQILTECETSIMKGEQSVRNAVVEATYHVMPQPNTTLVVCETGDYQIVEDNRQTIIEI